MRDIAIQTDDRTKYVIYFIDPFQFIQMRMQASHKENEAMREWKNENTKKKKKKINE